MSEQRHEDLARSGSAWIEDRSLCDGVSIIVRVRLCPSGIWAK